MSWAQGHIDEFRANGGRIGGRFEGRPVLLITTKGAKTGRPHTTPMMYLREDGHLYVFASKGGAPTHPDWYWNLVANPTVTVETVGALPAVRRLPAEDRAPDPGRRADPRRSNLTH
jgi:deazaflavin-dependent oxidoreductase (nitroreductase family)